MQEEHPDAYFEAGDTVEMGKSASIPNAEVLGIVERKNKLYYKLDWSTGNSNTKPVETIDTKAVNTTIRF